ncbi:MAG: cysteine--tRNA ligase [Candidatus Omnitrophica bacterium]|nr:cysteine--tRNA ligase [Candidatus Omnitrophota bacterium]MBU1128411.1 cysteine--tRNA ligase [Candidatus Omnitrophota bacterium]MBU1852291.1 cysteine--tRNA ligase [Candidatus Omnitrophota bacterium]
MLKIYNTLTKEKSDFKPIEKDKVKMYVCGPTVYDSPHIGHARSAYVFETARKYFEYIGFKVVLVRNVTDVDDKIINKAAGELEKTSGIDAGYALREKCREVAKRYLDEYHKAMDSLDIRRPDHEPKATENINEMIRFIEALLKKDHAYRAGGNVYFSVESFDKYGELSGQDARNMRSGPRADADGDKRHQLDFALWKKVKSGEPSWGSPWGEGRPGWHIECSVMSTVILGHEFDIHGGGLDLVFPHHENEKAQAEAKTGSAFAHVWMHNGFLTVRGAKMSKSLGNFITVEDYFKKHPDPDLLKIIFLSSHYRSPVDYSEDKVKEAAAAKARITRFIKNVELEIERDPSKNVPIPDRDASVSSFRRAMNDDFNTPDALSAIFEAVQSGNNFLTNGKTKEACRERNFIVKCADILGLSLKVQDVDKRSAGEIESLVAEREIARGRKAFQEADAIRERLKEMGVEIEDTSEGTIWRKN